jgi:hypothetical protein
MAEDTNKKTPVAKSAGILVRIEPHVHKKLRLLALQNDTNVMDILRQFIYRLLDEDGEKK